jgi:hypothetical protein
MSLNQKPPRLGQEGPLASAMKAAQKTGLQQERLDSIEKRIEQSLAEPTSPSGIQKGPIILGVLVCLVGGALLVWEEQPVRVPAVEQDEVVVSPNVVPPQPKAISPRPLLPKAAPKAKAKQGVHREAPKQVSGEETVPASQEASGVEHEPGESALTGEGTLPIELAMMESARKAFKSEDWKKANILLGKLVQTYPDTSLYVEATRLRALALSNLGHHAMAEVLLQKLLRSHTKPAKRGELLLLLAGERMKMGDCPSAVRSLKEALRTELPPAQQTVARDAIAKCSRVEK